MNAFLADLIVTLHLGIVSFCILGELAILLGALLGWEWIRKPCFRLPHLCLILYVAAEAVLGLTCPLTKWEYELRISAGQRTEEDLTFIARLVRTIIFYDFPLWVFTALYLGFGLVVLLSFIFIPPRWQNRKPRHHR